MKLVRLGVVILLVGCSAGWAQDDKGQEKPQEKKQEKQQERPTLGPPPAPSLYGPRTSTTTDSRKLARLRAIFVERMDNRLSEKLADGLSKIGRFRVVANRNEADAVLRGTCFDSHRLKSLHSEVFLTDRTSGGSIWQDIVRQPFNPPPLEKAVNDTALLILQHLADSVEEAQRK